MIQETLDFYLCEFCDFKTFDPDVADEHEATHFNLSPVEYFRWKDKFQRTAKLGMQYGFYRNETTKAAFDSAIDDLTKFENQHGLVDKKKPRQFYIV